MKDTLDKLLTYFIIAVPVALAAGIMVGTLRKAPIVVFVGVCMGPVIGYGIAEAFAERFAILGVIFGTIGGPVIILHFQNPDTISGVLASALARWSKSHSSKDEKKNT